MPSECCDEYKLIQLYQKSSVWCFAFSHASTFELIPQLPRLCRELGDSIHDKHVDTTNNSTGIVLHVTTDMKHRAASATVELLGSLQL